MSNSAPPHTVGSSFTTVDEIARVREQLRNDARKELGITGEGSAPPLRAVLRKNNAPLYPLLALGTLAMVDQFQSQAFSILSPDISRTLGLSIAAIAAARTVQFIAQTLAPLPIATLFEGTRRRGLLCIFTGIAWSVITLYTGFVSSVAALVLVLVVNGLATGSVMTVHPSLLVDSYPTTARNRILSTYLSFQAASYLVVPLLIALSTGVFYLTWRGVLLVLGGISFLSVLFAVRLRDPGYGGFDSQKVRAKVRQFDELPVRDSAPPRIRWSSAAIFRRLLTVPTIHRLGVGLMMFGVMQVPFATFMAFFLQQRWGLDTTDRALLSAGNSALAIALLLLSSRRLETVFRRDPGRAVNFAGITLATAVACIALSVLSPSFAGMVVAGAVGSALMFVMLPPLMTTLTAVVQADLRLHLGALFGLFLASGSVLGLLFLGNLATQVGTTGAIIALSIPGTIGAIVIRSSRRLIVPDIDRTIDDIVEDEEIRALRNSGAHLPLLACRHISVFYGQVQVLFDVSVIFEEGEMVALLGVNGAGKSTLLRAISGLSLPSAGTVRFNGSDITYLDPERRINLGIVTIHGGRTIFDSLTVRENLDFFAYSLGRDRHRTSRAIADALEVFPELARHMAQPAVVLSGGEQQMLSLTKALILEPKLLLIDELSLGLAPAVVARLLDVVRTINEEGTTIVLVEQSISLATSLAKRAYFMERGEIRFDGPTDALLDRNDLLRPVFLSKAETGAGT